MKSLTYIAVVLCVTATWQSAASAQNSLRTRLIGTWLTNPPDDDLISFGQDGSWKMYLKKEEAIIGLRLLNGTWALTANGTLSITFAIGDQKHVETGKLSYEGETMVITDSDGQKVRHRRHQGSIPARFQDPVSTAQSKDPAVARFQQEMKLMADFIAAEKAIFKQDPIGGWLYKRTVALKLRSVDTAKLPPDLRAAFAEYVGQTGKYIELLSDWPPTRIEVSTFVNKRLDAEGEKFTKEFSSRHKAIEGDLKPSFERLEALASKYGFVAPDIIYRE